MQIAITQKMWHLFEVKYVNNETYKNVIKFNLNLICFNKITATDTMTVSSKWVSVILEWCLISCMNVEHTVLHVWYGQYWTE